MLASAGPMVTLLHGVYAQGPLVIPAEEQKSPSALPTRKQKSIYDTITDTEMVEQVFGFLPSMIGGQEGPAPQRFEVRWALSFRGPAWQGMRGCCSVPDCGQPPGSWRSQDSARGTGRKHSEVCSAGLVTKQRKGEHEFLCEDPSKLSRFLT